MAARAFVTRYGNEQVTTSNFTVDAYFVVVDPSTYPGQPGQVCVVTVALNPVDSLTQWQTDVKNAVIAKAAALPSPFTVTAANVDIPVLA